MTQSPQHTRAALSAVLFLVLSVLSAFATPVKFDIPAQSAASALEAFTRQSSADVMFSASALRKVQSTPVSGEMEPDAALTLLLTGTGFTHTREAESKFMVSAIAPVRPGSIDGSVLSDKSRPVAGAKVTLSGTDQSVLTDRRGRFVFSEVPAGAYALLITADGMQNTRVTDVAVADGHRLSLSPIEVPTKAEGTLALDTYTVSAKKNDGAIELDPYAVTGARSQPFTDRNVDLPRTINDVQPYYIFDNRAIEESGTNSVEDFLRQRLTIDTTVMTNGQKTQFINGAPNPTTNGVNTNTSSSINLNGLGSDHTLILVNGRPMPGVTVFTGQVSMPSQPDVNGIPLEAIERIEVMPSSAGAIYGAGAEGGVINIVLKKAYNGGDISATYASTWDGHSPSRTVQGTVGKSFNQGRTQFFVTAQYADSSPLYIRDRADLYYQNLSAILARDPYFNINPKISTGTTVGPGLGNPFAGAVPNFRSSPAGTTLTFKNTGASFGSSYGTVPVGFTASSNPTALIPGQWNTTLPEDSIPPDGLLIPLGNYPRRKSVMATLTHDATDRLQLHADYSYNGNHAFSIDNAIGGLYTLPATSPANPFNQSIALSVPLNVRSPSTSNSATNAFTLGGTLKLPFDWVAHADYQWAQSSFSYEHFFAQFPSASGATFGNIGNGITDPYPTPLGSGLFNPLIDTLANPFDMTPFLFRYTGSSRSTSNDLILAASGPLVHLSWGEPRFSVRLEHSKTNQPNGNTAQVSPPDNLYPGLPNASGGTYIAYATGQAVDSVNGEIDLPLFKSKLPLLRALDLQFNVSFQKATVDVGTPGYLIVPTYAYNGGAAGGLTGPAGTYILGPNTLGTVSQSTTTGVQPYRAKAKYSSHSVTGPALSYKPINDVIVRASVASGYVPPTYSQLLPTNYLQTPSITSITDPKNNSRYTITSYNLGGNPNLNPTTSKSWDFGVVWQPSKGLLRGLRLDAEYVQTKQFNQILDPGVQAFINMESQFPSQVVRDPTTGLITTVYDKYINVAESKQSAWTYTMDYSWNTSLGSFEVSAADTIQEHNQQQIVAGNPFLEYVGFPNSGGVAKTKATGTLRWAFHSWVAAWTVVNYGSYKQVGALGDPNYPSASLLAVFQQIYGTGAIYNAEAFPYITAQGSDTVPSQTYHNLYLSYAFRKATFDGHSRWGRWSNACLEGLKISLVVNNVFNAKPPLDVYNAPFFVSPYGDIQLRNYAITVKKSF